MTDARSVLEARYVRFPPKWQNVLVPVRGRRSTSAGMTLYTASRPRALAAQRVLWLVARAGGARLVPGPREAWEPGIDTGVLARLWSAWTGVVGEPDGVAVYHRPQAHRTGLVLLVCGRRRSMLVRLLDDPTRLVLEQRLDEQVAVLRPRSIAVPRVIGGGEVDGWHWLGHAVMSSRPHAPARELPCAALEEISGLVERVVPRPPGTPDHWRGAHGDVSPWNLRRAARTTWLIDWEDACWAPPGADAVYFAATRAALAAADPTGPLDVGADRLEARDHWRDLVAARTVTSQEEQLQSRLLVLLGQENRS